VLFGVVYCSLAWLNTVLFDTMLCGVVWCCLEWFGGLVWFGAVWCSLVWFGMVLVLSGWC
jgi:hypothetical protein